MASVYLELIFDAFMRRTKSVHMRVHSPNSDCSGTPYTPYTDGAGERLGLLPLERPLEADVLVIGGGVTGLSTALHAAESGLKVVVLEGNEIGWGASGRNSGHVPAATRQEPSVILRHFGQEYGRRVIAASREVPELVYGLASRHGMTVEAVRTGGFQAAHNAAAKARLEQRVATLATLGYDIDLLDAKETARRIGSRPGLYCASTYDRAGGTINPLAYTRGLARAAMAAGVTIHEHSRVVKLASIGQTWHCATKAGEVRSRFVALCTNGYTADLHPALSRSVVPVRAYQFITTPLPEAVRQTILPGNQGFTDCRRLMSGIRLHPDGRLHFSGLGPLFGGEREPDVKASLARVRDVFPQVGELALEYWWSGWMAMNRESTWKLHELAPGLLATLGCNGRGIGLGTLFGRDLARYMAGMPAADLTMPFTPARRIPLHPIRQPLVSALVTSYRIMDFIETPGQGADGQTAAASAKTACPSPPSNLASTVLPHRRLDDQEKH